MAKGVKASANTSCEWGSVSRAPLPMYTSHVLMRSAVSKREGVDCQQKHVMQVGQRVKGTIAVVHIPRPDAERKCSGTRGWVSVDMCKCGRPVPHLHTFHT